MKEAKLEFGRGDFIMAAGVIVCFSDLDETKKLEVVEVFLDGFGHMFTFAKTRVEKVKLFSGSFEEALIYAYVTDNHVAGVLGLGTNLKRALKFDKQKCEGIFGKTKGRIVYNLLHKMAEVPAVKNDSDLYIDYLATDLQMRNSGIATKLLTFAFALPQYKECYIEVLSKNITAKKLYQKLGFTVHEKNFNIFTLMQGLGYPIMMKKMCNSPQLE